MAAKGAPRYAIFFTPPSKCPLWSFGSRWLGRDAVTNAHFDPVPVTGLEASEVIEVTRFPRHYGFHATLKPPFRLAPECTENALMEAVTAFAAARRAFVCPPLHVSEIFGFVALTLERPAPEMDHLAAECVAAFDFLRAPAVEADLARFRANGLTPSQDALLIRWGYPYVMEEFRFHMTLTGRVEDDETRRRLLEALALLFAPIAHEPLPTDALCVFAQEDGDTPLRLIHRAPFGGG